MYALPFSSNKILQAGSPKFVRSSTVSVYDLLSGPKRYWRFVLCSFTKRYCMEVSNLSKKNNFSIILKSCRSISNSSKFCIIYVGMSFVNKMARLSVLQGKNDLLCTQMKAGGTVHTTPLPEWAALSV